jgi:serine/threonine protein kinase
MKILRKSELQRRRQVERTQTERTILSQIKSHFVVQLYYAFQNESKLYMVMDFVQVLWSDINNDAILIIFLI